MRLLNHTLNKGIYVLCIEREIGRERERNTHAKQMKSNAKSRKSKA